MGSVSSKQEDVNSEILMKLLDRNGANEYIDCTQIIYYVDEKLVFKQAGEIMINRRDNYPKLQILSPNTGDYTETFQENSCKFTDLGNLDLVNIETSYTPYKIGRKIHVKVTLVF